jgi:hypothetical protein
MASLLVRDRASAAVGVAVRQFSLVHLESKGFAGEEIKKEAGAERPDRCTTLGG